MMTALLILAGLFALCGFAYSFYLMGVIDGQRAERDRAARVDRIFTRYREDHDL